MPCRLNGRNGRANASAVLGRFPVTRLPLLGLKTNASEKSTLPQVHPTAGDTCASLRKSERISPILVFEARARQKNGFSRAIPAPERAAPATTSR